MANLGNLQAQEAAAMLTLVDNRSGVQVAAAEGSASKTDFVGLLEALPRAVCKTSPAAAWQRQREDFAAPVGFQRPWHGPMRSPVRQPSAVQS